MELTVIIRNDYPVLVRKIKLSEIDRSKCSSNFLKHADMMLQNNPEAYTYAKVLNNGDFDYRKRGGDKLEYRFYDINKNEAKGHTFNLPEGRKVIL